MSKPNNTVSRFGPDPQSFFNSVYRDVAPWDIGEVQPAMAKLLARFPPAGPVLDIGCGSGDLAIYLAQTGLEVVGVDFVAAAIEQACRKARALSSEIKGKLEFRVGDALHPTLLKRQFGAVVDSGFFHLFTTDQCDHLVDEVAATLRAGGRYYLQEFATEFHLPNTPRAVLEAEIRARFTAERGWRILEVASVEFLNRIAPVPATIACIERKA